MFCRGCCAFACSRSPAGTRMFGLAPSVAAARVLGVEGGIGATTLQWLLTRYGAIAEGTASEEEIARARETFRDTVVVVDESSMVGTVQMRDLQRILEPLGVARLVLVGDTACSCARWRRASRSACCSGRAWRRRGWTT